MRIWLLGLVTLQMSCGTVTIRSKGHVYVHSESTVQTTSTIVLTVDVSACEGVPADQKLECIRTLIELYKEIENVEGFLQCGRDPHPESGSASTDHTVQCRRDDSAQNQ